MTIWKGHGAILYFDHHHWEGLTPLQLVAAVECYVMRTLSQEDTIKGGVPK